MNTDIKTERLLLTPLQIEDSSLFHEINIDPYVKEYLWDNEDISLGTVADILNNNQRQFKKQNCGLWKITTRESNAVIGYSGLWYFFDESQPQLIYVLLKPFTKKGYAFEAARAIIDYAFKQLNFIYLLASMDEGHFSSQRLAMRLGMELSLSKIVDGKPTLFYKISRD